MAKKGLEKDQVRVIWKELENKADVNEVAEKYNVSITTVRRIQKKQGRFKDMLESFRTPKLTDEEVIKIWKYKVENEAEKNYIIAQKFNVSHITVSRILNKQSRYGKIIDDYYTKANRKSRISKSVKSPKPAKLIKEKPKTIEEKNQSILENLDKLDYDAFVSIIYQNLAGIYQPFVLKIIHDNLLDTKKSKELINKIINEIQKTKNMEFIYESINTLLASIHAQLLVPKAFEKIVK